MQRWLHGQIFREDAELLLKGRPPGSFLVRASRKYYGDYTLSVVTRESTETPLPTDEEAPIQHYHINTSLGGTNSSTFFSLDNEDLFPSLRKLVEVSHVTVLLISLEFHE